MSHAVLIVDDEQHVLQAIKRLLRRDGYEIHVADNGKAALEILANTEIAVIICDQRMPGMSGIEVLAESVRLRPDAFRITLTGYTDLAAAQTSINEGCVNHFLLKPWDDDYLREVVRNGVRAYQLILDNRRLQALTRQQKAELERWNEQLQEEVEQQTKELYARNKVLTSLHHRLETALRDTVAILAGMLEAYSPNLGMHSKRVAQLARHLAEQLDLDTGKLRDVEFAGYLHDIGKIARTRAAERAPGQRPGHRRNQDLALEAIAGYSILSRVAGFDDIARGIRHQYEWFDGRGSPDGLRGTDIPLIARVIAVANAFDRAVFASPDPSRMLLEEGYRVLSEDDGRQFDPDLVQSLLLHLSEEGIDPGGSAEVEVPAKQLRKGMMISRPIYNADGVLLLGKGVTLTAELIQRVQEVRDIDSLVFGVFVRCTVADSCDDDTARSSDSPPVLNSELAAELSPAPQLSTTEPQRPHDSQPADAADIMPTASSSLSDRPSSALSRRRCKILVVDDTVLVCNVLKRQLCPLGIETVATADGRAALDMAANDHFDAVLIDLMMPAMSGEELIGHLGRRAPSLPCIIVTGNATKEQVMRLSKAPNVTGILTKPWEHHRLVAMVNSAVADHSGKEAEASV